MYSINVQKTVRVPQGAFVRFENLFITVNYHDYWFLMTEVQLFLLSLYDFEVSDNESFKYKYGVPKPWGNIKTYTFAWSK